MAERSDVSKEQLDILSRKLDEILNATERLCKKGWVMFVSGTFANICISAAFSKEATNALFEITNSSLSWLFQHVIKLLN